MAAFRKKAPDDSKMHSAAGGSNKSKAIFQHSKASLGLMVLIIVLPNLLPQIFSHYHGLVRPLINFDYVFVGVLAVFGFRLLGALLLVAFYLLDATVLALQVFPVIRVEDLLLLSRFILLSPSAYLWGILIAASWISLLVIGVWRLVGNFSRESGLIAFNAVIFLLIVQVYFLDEGRKGPWRYRNSEAVVASQALNYVDLTENSFISQLNSDDQKVSPATYTGELAAWFRKKEEDFNSRVLLIVNESWGHDVNQEITNTILSPITSLTSKVADLQVGQASFSGMTLAAELRELCSAVPTSFGLRLVDTGFEKCLPNRLRAYGFDTYALHGASGLMYDRIYWYPKAGFSETVFFESKVWPKRCFSFPGACDLDMAEEIPVIFSGPGKKFVYWLTLNSHAVYDLRDLRTDTFDCGYFEVDDESMTCRNLKLQAQFFESIARLVVDPRMRGVTVRIISDHPPPIFDQKEFAKYFEYSTVPWLEFTIL